VAKTTPGKKSDYVTNAHFSSCRLRKPSAAMFKLLTACDSEKASIECAKASKKNMHINYTCEIMKTL
jgi:hypothetical protein